MKAPKTMQQTIFMSQCKKKTAEGKQKGRANEENKRKKQGDSKPWGGIHFLFVCVNVGVNVAHKYR